MHRPPSQARPGRRFPSGFFDLVARGPITRPGMRAWFWASPCPASAGSQTWKLAPLPTSLSISSSPRWRLAHVLDDGEAEPGAAGIARAAAIHPVEALGQPGDCSAGMPGPSSLTVSSTPGRAGSRGPPRSGRRRAAPRRLPGHDEPHSPAGCAPPGRPARHRPAPPPQPPPARLPASPARARSSGSSASASAGRSPPAGRLPTAAGARSARCATGRAGRRSAGASARTARP